MLILPSVIGIIIFCIQIANASKFSTWTEAFNTPLNTIYCISVLLWTTYFVESWKRKEAKIADTWLMRDFVDPTLERE
jgi:hypothetical protein